MNIIIGTIEQEEYSSRLGQNVTREQTIDIKATITNGCLSISGNIGRNQGGQIDMDFEHQDPKQNDTRYTDNLIMADNIKFAQGWDKAKWFKLLDIWHRYHLNDMTPSCEHQEALGWGDIAGESVSIYKWVLKSDVSSMRRAIEEKAMTDIKGKQTAHITKEEANILNLEYWTKTETPEAPSEYYQEEKDHIETKTLGWLDTTEHSRGILSKPCQTCGYKYGSAWKKRELPSDVVDFINNLYK